jgi:hypothetical protein
MGGANGSRECAPDDKLSDTHQFSSYGDDGFRRLNPSCVLNLYWSFAASVDAKIDSADNKIGSSDLPVGRFVDRRVESFF